MIGCGVAGALVLCIAVPYTDAVRLIVFARLFSAMLCIQFIIRTRSRGTETILKPLAVGLQKALGNSVDVNNMFSTVKIHPILFLNFHAPSLKEPSRLS